MTPVFLLVALIPSAAAKPTVDFETEVLPILTRAGCNSGACHGSAAGRGGLRLSLWGSDPAHDHDAIVNELEGRRINLVQPARSLFLRKPTGDLNHGGGRKLEPDSEAVQWLQRWIETGAPRGPARKLVRLQVTPGDHRGKAIDEAVSLTALAHFDNGDKVDVTRWAVFTSVDPAAVEIEGVGKMRLRRLGQHVVLARFLDRIVSVRFTLPLQDRSVDLSKLPTHNYIDEEIHQTLQTLHLQPGPLVEDAAFLRRVTLDLTGTVPTPDKLRQFTSDNRTDKRERLIDDLLASDDFVDFWTLKWSQWLGVSAARLGAPPSKTMLQWLRLQVARNTPLDQLARELLTTTGDSNRLGPANYVRLADTPGTLAENISRVFLGARLQCANCHNHPLDRWTQDDYHGLAAIFAKLDRGPVVKVVTRGDVIHPRTGEPADPRLPGVRALDAATDQRQTLATWLTSPDNPAFARALVNRLWRELMGRGLVEPVDDLRATNPATHPVLLDKLAADLIAQRYNPRALLGRIARSAAYQRSSRTVHGFTDTRYYSQSLVKPLTAEVHADALASVTGVAERHGDLPFGTRAITLHDVSFNPASLEILGRCGRVTACEDGTSGGGLARVLHVINGGLLNNKITAADGRLQTWLDNKTSDADIIRELYERAYARAPSRDEAAYWAEQCRQATTASARRHLLEDFFWAVLTSKEFTTNH